MAPSHSAIAINLYALTFPQQQQGPLCPGSVLPDNGEAEYSAHI